jgi:hypothetical protein
MEATWWRTPTNVLLLYSELQIRSHYIGIDPDPAFSRKLWIRILDLDPISGSLMLNFQRTLFITRKSFVFS